jgi:hypothetical protein
MVSLRCTEKLRRRLGLPHLSEPGAPTNALGDWYANLVAPAHVPHVIFLSSRTFMVVVLPARDLANIPRHLMRALGDVLRAFHLPSPAVAAEIERMQPIAFGPTTDRKALGVLNQVCIEFRLEYKYFELSVHEWSLRLSERPISSLATGDPISATRAALGTFSVVM